VYWINRHNINNSSNNAICLADNSSSNESTQTASSIEPLLIELKTVLRSDQIELDIRECKSRGKPWSSFHKISEYPEVIVYPESTQNVSDVMRLCYKHRVPVVPFGGGTSLEGQILATRGGLSLDFNHMKSVVELNEKDMDMTVQAGLGYVELNEILRDKDLWFPLDPGPGASVGGMCACRCSGSTAVRYGSMRY
jgi:D-lactate dehydrogenase (cytochrome)